MSVSLSLSPFQVHFMFGGNPGGKQGRAKIQRCHTVILCVCSYNLGRQVVKKFSEGRMNDKAASVFALHSAELPGKKIFIKPFT